jgi:hypothetical protein
LVKSNILGKKKGQNWLNFMPLLRVLKFFYQKYYFLPKIKSNSGLDFGLNNPMVTLTTLWFKQPYYGLSLV